MTYSNSTPSYGPPQNYLSWQEPKWSQPPKYPQTIHSNTAVSPFYKNDLTDRMPPQSINSSFCFKPAQPQPKFPYTQRSQEPRFSQPTQPNAHNQKVGLATQNSRFPVPPTRMLEKDDSMRVITLQIRRLRGISTQMKRFSPFTFLIEILGRCVSCSQQFSNLPGFQFTLQDYEASNGSYGSIVNCVFYDFDGIAPLVQSGCLYRCVGRYHTEHRMFQCFTIEQCDDDLVRLVETFQFHSDRELANVIQAKNNSTEPAIGKRTVLKVSYTGLGGSNRSMAYTAPNRHPYPNNQRPLYGYYYGT